MLRKQLIFQGIISYISFEGTKWLEEEGQGLESDLHINKKYTILQVDALT